MTPTPASVRRLTIYLGEDKQNVDQPLFKSIVQEARLMHIAGATVIRGSAGFGRSAKMHTAEVLFSTDLPVIIVIVDLQSKIESLIERLSKRTDISLMTSDPVDDVGHRQFEA